MSGPWADFQMQEESPPWADYARPEPRKDTYQLWQQAQAGDPEAIRQYNTRAQSFGQPTLEQDREANSPVAGNSFLDNAWQATGRFWPNIARNFDSQEEVDRARQLDEPLMDTGGGVTGTIASNLAMFAGPQSAMTRGLAFTGRAAPYISAVATGGGAGALEPVGTGESRLGNTGRAALWGGGGQLAGDAIGAGARFLTPRMTQETSSLLDDAYAIGVKPDVGQISQNPLTRQVFNQLGRLPLSGAGGRAEANQIAFNRTVSEAYGVPADKITREVHGKAVNALSSEFNRLKAATTIPVGPNVVSNIQSTRQKVLDMYGEEAAKSFDYWAKNLLNRSRNGVIRGVDYQAWSSELSEKMPNLIGDRRSGASEIADVVENLAAKGLSPDDQKAWSEVRRRWAIMSQVEPLVAKSPTGDIPPAQLLNRLTATDAGKARVARGKGTTLEAAADVGQRFLKEPPDSGTAGRLGTLAVLQNIAGNPLAQTAGLAGGAYAADRYGYATPGQLGTLGALLLANRYGLKAGAMPSVVRGVPQRAIEQGARKYLPRLAVPYALSQPAAAEEKKKPKRP